MAGDRRRSSMSMERGAIGDELLLDDRFEVGGRDAASRASPAGGWPSELPVFAFGFRPPIKSGLT